MTRDSFAFDKRFILSVLFQDKTDYADAQDKRVEKLDTTIKKLKDEIQTKKDK